MSHVIRLTSQKEVAWATLKENGYELTIEIEPKNLADCGKHRLMIIATAKRGETLTSTMFSKPFEVEITGSSSFRVNKEPEFSKEIPLLWIVKVGDEFSYKLPEITDPENDQFNVTTWLGPAMIFMKFTNNTLTIDKNDTTDDMIGVYTIIVKVEDLLGAKVEKFITLIVNTENPEKKEKNE
jgi:hypothetical protein